MSTVIPPRRQHPAAMLRHSFRYLLLLTLPLVRGVRYIRLPNGLHQWVRGVWIDLVAVVLLIVFVYTRWRWQTYSLTDGGFRLKRGLLLLRDCFIPRGHITTLTVERPLHLRILRAARIVIDTDAGDRYRADLILTVSEKHACEILAARKKHAHQTQHRYKPRPYHVVVLSLLVSNSLSGVLLLATALHHSTRILGEYYRQQVIGNLEAVADYVNIIPRTAALIILVLLCGWGVAAARNLLRHLPFAVTRFARILAIRTGQLTRRDHSCTVDSINYLDIRQTLVCKLLHLHVVFIHCIGYGKQRDALSLLVPACGTTHSEQAVRGLLPQFRRAPVTIRPAPYSLFRYTLYPLCAIAVLSPVAHVASQLFSSWREIIEQTLFIAYIPCLWLLTIKIIDRYTAGIAKKDGFVTVRYSDRLTLHTIVIPTKKIVAYRFRQSVFQRRRDLGDVIIHTYSEDKRCHRVKNVRKQDVDALLR